MMQIANTSFFARINSRNYKFGEFNPLGNESFDGFIVCIYSKLHSKFLMSTSLRLELVWSHAQTVNDMQSVGFTRKY